jgi:hypothetical protein
MFFVQSMNFLEGSSFFGDLVLLSGECHTICLVVVFVIYSVAGCVLGKIIYAHPANLDLG